MRPRWLAPRLLDRFSLVLNQTMLHLVLRIAPVALFLGALAAQSSVYDRALAALQRADPQAALTVLDSVDPSTELLDHLMLRARALVALDRAGEARGVADRVRQLHEQRQSELVHEIEQWHAARRQRSSEAVGAGLARAPVEARDTLAALGRLKHGVVSDAEMRRNQAELLNELTGVVEQLVRADRSADVGGVLESVVRNDRLDSQSRVDAVLAVARTKDGATASAWRGAMVRLLQRLFAESRSGGGGSSEGERAQPAGESTVSPSTQFSTIVVSAFQEMRLSCDAAEVFTAAIDGGLYAPAAATLRLMASTLNRWAVQLEARAASDPRRAAGTKRFLMVIDRLARHDATRGIAEDALQPLRRWTGDPVADAASVRLADARERYLSEAERCEAREEWGDAARFFERASLCDPANLAALQRAAQMFEKAKDIAASARALRVLIARADKPVADASQRELRRLWGVGREQLDAFDAAVVELPRDAAGSVKASARLVKKMLPVLDGPRLDAIRSLIADDNFQVAKERLEALINEFRRGEPARPGRLDDSSRLRVGDEVRLPGLGLQLDWVGGAGESSELWRSALVDRTAWQRAMKISGFGVASGDHGGVKLSRDNADAFCLYLTGSLTEVGALSAEHEYALPSIAELERVHAAGQLPTTKDAWLWTRDNAPGFDAFVQTRPIGMVWRPSESAERSVWRASSEVAFLVVLRRRNATAGK